MVGNVKLKKTRSKSQENPANMAIKSLWFRLHFNRGGRCSGRPRAQTRRSLLPVLEPKKKATKIKKNIALSIAIIMFALGIALLCVKIELNRANSIADIIARNTVLKIDSILKTNSNYNDLSKEIDRKGISLKIKDDFFQIDYKLSIKADYYELQYYQLPLGPFKKYSSKNKEWTYEE